LDFSFCSLLLLPAFRLNSDLKEELEVFLEMVFGLADANESFEDDATSDDEEEEVGRDEDGEGKEDEEIGDELLRTMIVLFRMLACRSSMCAATAG